MCIVRVPGEWHHRVDAQAQSARRDHRDPRGRVKRKGPDGRMDLDVWIESSRGEMTAPGSATVILAARS